MSDEMDTLREHIRTLVAECDRHMAVRERILEEQKALKAEVHKATADAMPRGMLLSRVKNATGAKTWDEAIERVQDWANEAWAEAVTLRELTKAKRLLARLMEATCTADGEDAVQVVEAMCNRGAEPHDEE